MLAYFYAFVEKIQDEYNTTRAIVEADSGTANDFFSFDSNNNNSNLSTSSNTRFFTSSSFFF